MASKGKSKLKRHQSIFGSKCIDVKRFAYDVIVHSALRFKVPKNCISIWEGSENDYGCPEFCLVVSRLIIRDQIVQRFALHKLFNNRYASNKLESFKCVGDLLQEVIGRITGKIRINIISEVETSLSIACELVLFLYSKNSNLYLKELAGYWFDCYFRFEKKKFEKEGGLDSLYERGKDDLVDAFYDTFISVHCLPYEASVQDEHLKELFYQSSDKYEKKITGRYSSKEVVRHDSASVGYIAEHLIDFFVPFLTSELDEATGIDLPVNTLLGIIPHGELLLGDGALDPDRTASQNVPVASPQEGARHRRGSSGRQRRPKGKSSLCSSVEQGLGQLHLGEDSGIDLPVNTGLGIIPHEKLLRDDGVLDPDTTESQNVPVASPQEGARHRRGSSGRQRRPKGKSILCSSVEQGLGQLGLDSSGAKKSSKKKPSFSAADDPTSPQNLPCASRQEPARHRTGSSGQQKTPKGKSSLCSSVEQGLRQLRLDSSGAKKSSEKKPSVSGADDPTSSQNLPCTSRQEPARHRTGSSGQQKTPKGKSNSRSSEAE